MLYTLLSRQLPRSQCKKYRKAIVLSTPKQHIFHVDVTFAQRSFGARCRSYTQWSVSFLRGSMSPSAPPKKQELSLPECDSRTSGPALSTMSTMSTFNTCVIRGSTLHLSRKVALGASLTAQPRCAHPLHGSAQLKTKLCCSDHTDNS